MTKSSDELRKWLHYDALRRVAGDLTAWKLNLVKLTI